MLISNVTNVGKLELLSLPFTHSLVLRISEGGNTSWSPEVPEKVLRTGPRPGDGSGPLLCARTQEWGVSSGPWLIFAILCMERAQIQEKSLCAQPGTCSCWKICTDLNPFLPSTAPSSPGRCRDPTPSPTPCGGSRDPPLMPPFSHLATHWGNSLITQGFMGTGQLCNPWYSLTTQILVQLCSSLLRNSAKPTGTAVTSPVATSPINSLTAGARQEPGNG